MLSARAIATQGIGYSRRLVAVQGFGAVGQARAGNVWLQYGSLAQADWVSGQLFGWKAREAAERALKRHDEVTPAAVEAATRAAIAAEVQDVASAQPSALETAAADALRQILGHWWQLEWDAAVAKAVRQMQDDESVLLAGAMLVLH